MDDSINKEKLKYLAQEIYNDSLEFEHSNQRTRYRQKEIKNYTMSERFYLDAYIQQHIARDKADKRGRKHCNFNPAYKV